MVEIFNVIPHGSGKTFRALPIPHVVSYYPFDDHCRDVERGKEKQ